MFIFLNPLDQRGNQRTKKRFLKIKKNKDLNMWNTTKAGVLRRKFRAIQAYIREKVKNQSKL